MCSIAQGTSAAFLWWGGGPRVPGAVWCLDQQPSQPCDRGRGSEGGVAGHLTSCSLPSLSELENPESGTCLFLCVCLNEEEVACNQYTLGHAILPGILPAGVERKCGVSE